MKSIKQQNPELLKKLIHMPAGIYNKMNDEDKHYIYDVKQNMVLSRSNGFINL